MTSLVLSSVGGALGSILGPIGGAVGSYIGASVGSYFDRKIFNTNKTQQITGYRLDDLSVQTSTYGKTIPIIYGKIRISGNIIWSMPIKEVVSTEMISQQSGKGISGRSQPNIEKTNYNYFINVAIAICEGEIDSIDRIWADNKLLDKTTLNFRLYCGDERQLPDSLIQSVEGIDQAPAYRGLAYIVIEDFQINEFGNRIPNFTVEAQRNLVDKASVEHQIEAINMIPGSGEFVYDTQIQYKQNGEELYGDYYYDQIKSRINNNTESSDTDAIIALDQMKSLLPNIKYISVVVTWFGSSLNVRDCKIYPAVEYQNYQTSPDGWSVAGRSRHTAKEISRDINGKPLYGGTVSDSSLINYLVELRKRGYKIILYPMIFMDMPNKPWRGHITGEWGDLFDFFDKKGSNGIFSYTEFILHYASLAKNYIDGIIIGSELKGITAIQDSGSDTHVGVARLMRIADSARDILGADKIITYAADWSEYHSDYMLKLWNSENIDVIGIDAYFPLTDIKSYSYQPKLEEIMDSWTSGEGYDYFYQNGEKIKYDDPQYAWKNLEYWWKKNNFKKKIWFTEYGFPSIHGATNSPNVFYNPESSDGGLPAFSNGGINFDIQRLAIEATIKKWKNSEMVTQMFLWCYDARPYPYFPISNNIWSDSHLWIYGHWVNGKLGRCLLSKILKDLMSRLKVKNITVNTDQISSSIDGFIINNNMSILDSFKILQQYNFFDIVEREYEIKFIARGYYPSQTIDHNDLLMIDNEKQLIIKRNDEYEVPKSVSLNFISGFNDYDVRNVNVSTNTTNCGNITYDAPIVMNPSQAEGIANIILYSAHYQREQYEFCLPLSYSYLEPGDVIQLWNNDNSNIKNIKNNIVPRNSFGLIGNNKNNIINGENNIANGMITSIINNNIGIINNNVNGNKNGVDIIKNNINKNNTKNIINTQNINNINYTKQDINNGSTNVMKIININHGQYLTIQAIIEDLSLYYFRQTASLLSSGSISKINKISLTQFEYAIVPPLLNETSGHLIIAACGEESYWRGAVGLQNGMKHFFSINTPSNFGISLGFNSIGNEDTIDTQSELYIQLTSGEISSIESLFNDEENWALIGGEIIKFQNAELVSGSIYKLKNFIRGLFGTEYYIDNHIGGEKFIMLDDKIVKIELSDNDAGQIKEIKIISFGDNLANAKTVNINYGVNYLYNYSICHPRVSKLSLNELLIKWEMRALYNGEWIDFRDVLDDKNHTYEITFIEYISNKTHRVTITGDKKEVSYKFEMPHIKVFIYKLSTLIGRGYGLMLQIDTKNSLILSEKIIGPNEIE